MKIYHLITIYVIGFLSIVGQVSAQDQVRWVVRNIQTINISSYHLQGISDNGRYIFDTNTEITVQDTVTRNTVFQRNSDPGSSIAWSNETLVYGEYRTMKAGNPTCDPSATTSMTFGFYDASSSAPQK
jgi:hypothetical protein